jgi:hypothetical protein
MNILSSIHSGHRKDERRCGYLAISSLAYRALFLSLTAVLCSSSLTAGEIIDIPLGNASVIHNPDLSGNQGVTTVNVSAGNSNLQANIGVIAIGADGEITDKAYVSSLVIQKNQQNFKPTPDKATANITGHAFSNSSGWTAVNQASGQANSQANMLEISIGGEYEIGTVNDQMLAQSFSEAGEREVPVASQNSERSAGIDDTALSGMRGVIQVNQAAGTGNVTSNTFAFQINGTGN